MLKAPFNFVPLSPTGPFIPNWGDQVSQDLPFSDGLSGKITLNIKAETDIFVRNGSVAGDASFNHVGGRFFVPGTSIKGAIRSVFEIVTFGKMTQFNHDIIAYRDLSDATYRGKLYKQVHAGWMVMRGEKYYLYCRNSNLIDVEHDRINARGIDAELGRGDNAFYNFIHNSRNFMLDSNRTAKKKYEMLFGASGAEFDRRSSYIYVMRNGAHRGKCLVLTGQPGFRREPAQQNENQYGNQYGRNGRRGNANTGSGKGKEFLFPAPPMDSSGNILWTSDDVRWKLVPEEDIKSFKAVNQNSPDYEEFWSKVLGKGGAVPVFYIEQNGQYLLGLSYMFKYQAEQTVEKAIPQAYQQDRHDMAELLFGYTESQTSLKGRVHVGHAFIAPVKHSSMNREYAMSSPKSSYYPLYLKNTTNGVTWDSPKGVEIAGFKRYPTRPDAEEQRNIGEVNPNMRTSVKPLLKGTEMLCEIVFHNLKRVEFGALWYTLTALKHYQLGGLKPYGYGKVSIKPSVEWRNSEGQVDACVEEFKKLIAKHVNPNWESSATIRELKAMAEGIRPGKESLFTYMHLDSNLSLNEFYQGKRNYRNGERFQPFTIINQKH
jgi:CRISPR-associated protein (TIGR03986 family)